MLLGIWKSIVELEEHITLKELEAILEAKYDHERRQQKFAAALKGINIDGPAEDDVKDRFEAVKNRVEAKNLGVSEDQLAFSDLGIDFED